MVSQRTLRVKAPSSSERGSYQPHQLPHGGRPFLTTWLSTAARALGRSWKPSLLCKVMLTERRSLKPMNFSRNSRNLYVHYSSTFAPGLVLMYVHQIARSMADDTCYTCLPRNYSRSEAVRGDYAEGQGRHSQENGNVAQYTDAPRSHTTSTNFHGSP